jgi:hypothetical protein
VLREVPAPSPAVAGNGVFAIIVVGMLVGGMVLLLVLNTTLAQGSFELGALNRTERDLAVQEQRLVQQVALAESPEALQHRADRLGMVPASTPVFLRLADGAVLGLPRPAEAPPARAPLTATNPGTTTTAMTGTTTPAVAGGAGAPPAGTARTQAEPESDAAVADAATQSDAARPDAGAQP